MSNTLTNFLVGIGWDTSDFDQGTKHVHSSMGSIKSSILQTGVALAGAFGVKALTSGFADMADQAGKFGQTYGVVADDLMSLGRAIEYNGGQAESAYSALAGIEKMRAGILTGDAGWIATAGRAGLDTTGVLSATNAFEAMLSISDQFQAMSTQQRLNAAESLGFDDATLRLLSGGSDQMRATIESFRAARPLTQEMTQESSRFNQELVVLKTNIGGVADQISISLLPKLTDIVEGTNDWYMANQKLINQGMGEALKPVADNFGAIATSVVLLATGSTMATIAKLAQYVPAIGGGLSMAAGAASTMASVAGAGIAGYTAGTMIRESGVLDTAAQEIGYKDYQQLFNYRMDQILGKNVSGLNEGEGPLFGLFDAADGSPGSLSGGWGMQAVPQRPQPTTVNVNATLEMDGKVLAEKVISVVSDSNQEALDNLQSTTER